MITAGKFPTDSQWDDPTIELPEGFRTIVVAEVALDGPAT